MTKKGKSDKTTEIQPKTQPWIPLKKGLIVVGIVSIFLAIWVAWQTSASLPLGESILWGFIFGLSVWGVFGLFLLINRFFRR